jgi:glutaredoxin
MPRLNRQNIDRKTNKPEPTQVESLYGDRLLNRATQTRRDDDVIRTPRRTMFDVDYAIKWFIENEIQPQIKSNQEIISVPIIFANGEKWDNVQRLGYLRDEKGKLQSPMIMLKRSSVAERDNYRTLDVNWPQAGNQIIHRTKYNERNRYEDELFPIPNLVPANSNKVYLIDIPKYVTVEYEMMLWCDFTTQMNNLVDQILPYGRFAWGNEANKFATSIGSISFETVNTVGEDRLVRSTIPLTVQATLLAGQEARLDTIKKMYSVKKISYDTVVDVGNLNIFSTTTIPQAILQQSSQVISGGSVVVSGGGSSTTINAAIMLYLINLTEKTGLYVSGTTITINAFAAINPNNLTVATVNEFDIYINGQYIDKAIYTWTPSDVATQTITFNTALLGYGIDPTDMVIIKGRWQ